MLARLESVSKFYGERLVLRAISLEARAGEVLLVAGPNGAGKSTLLKIMAGLIRPDEGEATLLTPAGAAAYLGHKTFIYGKLSALDNLLFWARLHGLADARNRALEQLDRLGLAGQARDPAGTFSRGMMQRLSLARVFLLSPRILYLDEPDTGLDLASKAVLRRAVLEAKERGMGVVWVSHDPAADLVHAGRAALLAERGLAYCGPTAGMTGASGPGTAC
ncbi:MAG: ABC transporter ATP-binding protein [Desulfovibrionaceae bacterium]|nr:ABC transporter ATP-binding protein [Desulfovibrionaceae bacterium]MBF0514930.1 ABC transporter ATP-binding protein [Desulfovibrionaceae bacterium]